MCATCGCGIDEALVDGIPHDHDHPHIHDHDHPHTHAPAEPTRHASGKLTKSPDRAKSGSGSVGDATKSPDRAKLSPQAGAQLRRVAVETELLARNDELAADIRHTLAHASVLAVNLLSSPGSGKTTLLVETIRRLTGHLPMAVIEGDQQTSNDADRIRATGVPAIQVNTGKGCHLDAHLVGHAVQRLPLADLAGGILFIENVGNLVCPAAFDLGEAHKVVVFSVTEGEDKPLKYPDMFRAAALVLLNKCDLLPHLDTDADLAETNARLVNPDVTTLRVSARSGQGLDAWLDWLSARVCR